jgi:hypothetical protein
MLFDRTAEIIVGQSGKEGIQIKDLRMSFKIEKTATETLNTSTVRIWNLNASSRALVETPNNAVIVKAGYTQDIGALTIFVGIVRRSLSVQDGPNWITELELDDGLIAYRDSKCSLSFNPGISGSDVIVAIANQFGLPVRPFPEDVASKQYADGFSFVGRTRDAMRKCCNYLNLEWSIQNQEISILKKGGVAKRTAIVLSADTGMIGVPKLEAKTMGEKAAAKKGITTNTAGVIKRPGKTSSKDGEVHERLEIQGYKVNSLLQPTIQPGSVVQLKSSGIDGEYFRVEKVVHSGDTHGKDWETEMTLRFI